MDIDINFAKRGIKDYFDKAKYPYVRFVALGEPTQNFDTLRKLHAYARRLTSNQVKFEIQTNGFFDKDIASWIARNIHEVWLSFDGLPDVHDKIRRSKDDKPTSGVILRNLKIMQKRTFVGFRTTIMRLNVRRQLEALRFAHKHKVKAIFTKIMLPPANIAPQHKFYQIKDSLGVDIMDYAVNFVKAWKLSRKLGIFVGNGYINNFDEICEYACRACVPCPHLTPDGYVSACDRATYGRTPLQEFIYGRYDPVNKIIEYDEKKIKTLRLRNVYNMPECQNCKVKFRCAGGCLGTYAQLTGSMFKVIPEYCKAIRYMFENIDWDPRQGLFPYFMT
ncbi:MAG: hypothetical protein AMJ95_02345 [Omnitrophica WOR_2 bacterium SM23_72]|nr:MAG: hypothetical protein AMJ95_02345 [Omnitrophica WOR_2 bacterium SM23_72]